MSQEGFWKKILGDVRMCLLLGPSGAGKTLLLMRLNSCSIRGNYSDLREPPSTIPTVGTNLMNVVLSRRGEVTVRELGGSMVPIWYKYYKDAKAIIYVIDASNQCQISASCIFLLDILNNPLLHDVPVLILFNKIDSSSAIPRVQLDDVFRINDLLNVCSQKLTIQEISARDGQGLREVTKWLQEHVKPS